MTQPKNMPRVGKDRCIDRRSLVRHIQRTLVPFLSAGEVDARLAEVEASGVLPNHGPNESRRFELERTLNICLFDHPTFFEAREARAIQQENDFWKIVQPQDPIRRYRIEQRATVSDRQLLDDGLIQIWIPVPRAIDGIQEVRLLNAEPAELVQHYLPTAGQIYGVSLLIEPGKRIPPLRLLFDVEQAGPAPRYNPDDDALCDIIAEGDSKIAAEWVKELDFERLPTTTTQSLINSVIDRIEKEFRFRVSTRSATPVSALLHAGAGDVQMCTRLLAASLSTFGLIARIRSGQRLMLSGNRATLSYPGSTGYDHVFTEWHDPDTGESGFVDLSYLERWSFAATEANTTNDGMRSRLHDIGKRGREWLRANPYPIDFVLGGCIPRSRMYSFSSEEIYTLNAPVDLEFTAVRLQ